MGKIKKGILGGFNGRVGNVIGGAWKGVAYMRSEAQSIKNPRTPDQVANRTLFGRLSDLMSKSLSVVNNGFASQAQKKSAFNVAVQKNMKTLASSGDDFDFEALEFSNGNLTPFVSASATRGVDSISIEASLLSPPATSKQAFAIAVFEGDYPGSPAVTFSFLTMSAGDPDVTISVGIPQGITYTAGHVYIFCYDPDTKDASITFYVGSVVPE